MKTMKAIEWADRIERRADGYTRKQYTNALKKLLDAHRVSYSPATYDEAGNCKVCGEAGRCPGVHTLDEMLEMGFDCKKCGRWCAVRAGTCTYCGEKSL